ncbi:hypothetical protein [Paracoccus sp. (in: a-proteobacteria)]|uniref:hypothetical protein n=1 Tax=Paracoccus sp. TaxID=267 RepID=UPI0026DF5775|nr:hypothetical protein [Paracoccus sp. (in: a-proteobacteria)]MDO5647729.1 hypothetical protein [Paracoccus sp. (in: a-proteobacteria)]
MTPNLITGLVPYPAFPIPAELLTDPQDTAPDYATVVLGSRRTAQGPVLRRHFDGRITIDAGGQPITGLPVSAAPRGRSLWERLTRA